MPQFTSVRAVENVEIGWIDMNSAYLNGVLTSNDAAPVNEAPRCVIPAEFAGKTCCVRIPLSVPKDSGQLMRERVLYAMDNEPGNMQREGQLGAIFRRRTKTCRCGSK